MGANVRRPLTTGGCYHCRSAVLKLFTTPISTAPVVRTVTTLPTLRPRCTPRGPRDASALFTRHLSSAPKVTTESSTDQLQHAQEEDEVQSEGPNVSSQDSNSNGADDVPWYLQVEPPRHVATMEPPPLPEVPPDSPAVLGALVEYASEEMGLGDLSLLDLRQLDPPPALGPNLFMIFGTARSERHLNVSAGRLLRWLRAKHHVWADADGLLGPNERKTKLRRMAKRAKLLGTMGTDNTDDGIKTGWICVNFNTAKHEKKETAIVSDDGRVAGFGVAQTGSTIVVQIMTESRRAELGLEALWEQALGPSTVGESAPEAEPKEKPSNLHPLEKAILSSSPTRPSVKQARSKDSPLGQASFYHTLHTPLALRTSSTEALSEVLTYDGPQKRRVLDLLRARLNELPPTPAVRALGETAHGQISTPTLELFEIASKSLPRDQTWEYRLAMHAKACESGHVASLQTLDDVRDLIHEMRTSGIEASREQCLQLLACIYYVVGADEAQQSKLAIELLQTMHLRGQVIIANDVLATIIEARVLSSTDESSDQLAHRLWQLRIQAKLPCLDEPALMRLMTAYGQRRHNYASLWEIWRMPPRYLRPRSAAMYEHMYRVAVATQRSTFCKAVARQCFQEMLCENPPVQPVGKVRQALLECIRVADSRAIDIAETVSKNARGFGARLASREFVKLVRTINGMGN